MIAFSAEVQKTQGEGAWYFVMLTDDAAQEIREETAGLPRRGFGGVKVEVTVAGHSWLTSAFPDSKTKSYFLPLKAQARKIAGISVGELVEFRLRIVTEPQALSLTGKGAKR